MALDVLLPRYHYTEIGIIHTDRIESGIAAAYKVLIPHLESYYTDCEIVTHELVQDVYKPLMDITDQATAQAYFYGLMEVIRVYRQQFIPVHLLVSGGRKAMSVYATVAATYLFGEQDRVWTVLTEPKWMTNGVFHLPAGNQDAAHVVELPLIPSNMPAGAMTSLEVVANRRSPRQRFLESLSKQEAALAEVFRQHPYATNDQLGEILGKANRTVENQLRSIYIKMFDHFDMNISDSSKRQALLDILNGRT